MTPAPSKRASALCSAPSALLLGLVLAVVWSAGCGGSQSRWDDLPASSRDASRAYEERYLTLLDDFERVDGPVHVALGRGETSVTYAVEAGWCYAFLGVGETGVIDLDMELFAEDGERLSGDTMFDATPFVQQCADVEDTWRISLRVVRGRGDASLGVQRKPD